MKAAVLRAFGRPLEITDVPPPAPRDEAVLVRVRGAGVCHSDLHIADGHYEDLTLPLIPGHEIAGEAEGLGPVLVYLAWGCGRCAFCARGEDQLCPEAVYAGWNADGGYAEWVRVPSRRYLLPLGDLDPVAAAPLADAGVTPYRAVRRIRSWLQPGSTVLVIGCGGLGQFAIQYLKLLTPARVFAVDIAPTKRDRARELGADDAGPPDAELPDAAAVLDFVGSDDSLALAVEAVEPSGIVVQIGAAGGQVPFGMDAVPFEVHLTTSIAGSLGELGEVIDLARSGRVRWHVEPMPLARANEALERLRRGDVLGRIVLIP